MKNIKTLDHFLQRDHLILLSGLLLISLLSWYYIIYLYRQMYPMNMDAFLFAMPMTARWSFTDFVLLFLMWLVMMVAMMTPSVAPLIMIFAMVNRKKKESRTPYVSAQYLLFGYFIIWAVFSFLATGLQWFFQKINWLNPEMVVTNQVAGGTILIAAGVFQFTKMKSRCLQYCQTPVAFIHKHWREGIRGALQMGMKNGLYCLGCCWILMVILFVSGIMNLLWIAIITGFVLVEKLFTARWISYLAGIALIFFGLKIWIMPQ